jgi:hypothetical protein
LELILSQVVQARCGKRVVHTVAAGERGNLVDGERPQLCTAESRNLRAAESHDVVGADGRQEVLIESGDLRS